MPDRGPVSWPYQSDLELGAINSAVPSARLHARLVLQEWGLPSAEADSAELIVSELVTNALQACERLNRRADLAIVPVVRLWLVSDGISVIIHIEDPSDEMPVRQQVSPDEENGRGLMLVEALGKDWGVYRKAGSKVVWVMIVAADP
jgi:anti-sigma regulatory factor (Ser/Thr protein kinase)